MKKILHILNINNFFPELFSLTYPTIESYAKKYGYMINIIRERKFSDYPINYEKLQVYEDGKGADVNILCDADMLIHPQFPNIQDIFNPTYVAFNDNYNISWKYHVDKIRYFVRDGRDVGIATNFVISSNLTHDIWEPLSLSHKDIEELAKKENTEGENDPTQRGWGHYADEFALSYNLAKYGLKYHGICAEDWQRPFLVHTGTGNKDEALQIARTTLEKWSKL